MSHFSSTPCIAAMTKRAQQESGERRVTAKSRPMMNLTARTRSFVSSSASSNPGRTSYGYQDPGKSVASDDRTGKPDRPSPSSFSKKDYGRSWSSQEWKSGAAEHDRSGKREVNSWDLMQQVAPHREEPVFGRNTHSARYGELIHDRTGKPAGVLRRRAHDAFATCQENQVGRWWRQQILGINFWYLLSQKTFLRDVRTSRCTARYGHRATIVGEASLWVLVVSTFQDREWHKAPDCRRVVRCRNVVARVQATQIDPS